MDGQTRFWTDLDYEHDGKQVGSLNLPHSVNQSARGLMCIPACVVRNGAGPTVLLMAGSHGDEFEGQIALARLVRTLEPEAIRGRVIILPAVNMPAALTGERISPVDGRNLNRSFPGDLGGTPTLQIAHYLDTALFPLANLVCDFHSGGASLDYLHFASTHQGQYRSVNERGLSALRAMGVPLCVQWQTSSDLSFASHATMRHGVPYISGEYGSGGGVSRAGVALIEHGIKRVLAHMGLIPKDAAPPPAEKTRFVRVPSRDHFVYAPEPGLFEPAVDLGEAVKAGQLCGEVIFVDNPAREPVPCTFKADGFVICKRHLGRVERGDCVAHLAVDV